MHGRIVALQVCPGHRKPMRPVESVQAVEKLGLKDDMHALPDSSRQVLLIEQETLNALGLKPGEVKENITTEGIALMPLRHKQRIQIGEEVILEITKACSPCSRMNEIREGLITEITGRRGMLARVLRGGIVKKGDVVRLVEP